MEEKNTSRGLLIGIVIAALAVAGLVVFVLSSQPAEAPDRTSDQTETTTEPSEQGDDAVQDPSERTTIAFTGNGFEPSQVTVKRGTVITIKNDSSRSVQFSSDDHPAHRDNTEMNMQTLAPGESGSYTTTTAGEWGYHDHLDESKTGTITVTE